MATEDIPIIFLAYNITGYIFMSRKHKNNCQAYFHFMLGGRVIKFTLLFYIFGKHLVLSLC